MYDMFRTTIEVLVCERAAWLRCNIILYFEIQYIPANKLNLKACLVVTKLLGTSMNHVSFVFIMC